MYGIYANIWGILMVNVSIYGIHTDPLGIQTATPAAPLEQLKPSSLASDPPMIQEPQIARITGSFTLFEYRTHVTFSRFVFSRVLMFSWSIQILSWLHMITVTLCDINMTIHDLLLLDMSADFRRNLVGAVETSPLRPGRPCRWCRNRRRTWRRTPLERRVISGMGAMTAMINGLQGTVKPGSNIWNGKIDGFL